MANHEKEFLYVGHYTDTEGNYILKIGTTCDLTRRKRDHTKNYRIAKKYTMPENETFCYDWHLPLSKYNTLRYEDKNIALWKEMGFGEYVRNDRFCCGKAKPKTVTITIKKIYEVSL